MEFASENENEKKKIINCVYSCCFSGCCSCEFNILSKLRKYDLNKVARKAKSQKQILETCVNEKFHAC